MLALMNWWWPHSAASILSALDMGYNVHVIVSDFDRKNVKWLFDRQSEFPEGQISWSRDKRPRHSKASHTLTRFDYLPEVLTNRPVLVTDADVIHQRKLTIPSGTDVALWRIEPRPEADIEGYAVGNGFPLWWSEACNHTMAEAMVVFPTEHGRAFAHRIRRFADSLREDGFGDRWGNDQVAIISAQRRLGTASIYDLNANSEDVTTGPHASIWFPHPHQREDAGSHWARTARRFHVEAPADTAHMIEVPGHVRKKIKDAGLITSLPATGRVIQDTFVTNTLSEHNPAGTRDILEAMLPVAEKHVGMKLWPESTFSRTYRNGAYLKPHRDRPGLDWTISLCLATDREWPIQGLIDGEWVSFFPTEDSAVLTPGRRIQHRRLPFEGQENVILLLHYTEDERYAWGSKP